MYFYESHLSGVIYTTDYEKDFDELYCEECGDSDWYIGEFDSWEDFISQIDPKVDFTYCSQEFLADMSGLTVGRVLELNPKIKADETVDSFSD